MKLLQFYTKSLNFNLALLIMSVGINAQDRNSQPLVPGNSQQENSQQDSLEGLEGYEYQFPAMGTLVQLKAYNDDANETERIFQAAERRVQEIADVLTDYDASSETRQLTTRAFNNPSAVSADLWNVLSASQHWYKRSDGAFDSSLGQVTSLWRKYRQAAKHNLRAATGPPKELIAAAVEKTGWQNIKLDSTNKTICICKPEIRLDFGGVGKGYAVDAAYEVLSQSGLNCCLVNISGNMRMGAPPPGRNGWRLEIAPLSQGGPPLRQIEVANCAIATSGDLWQYIVIDGARRSHILDPRTGIGVLGPVAATVIARSATDADAMATIATVLNPTALKELHEELEGYAVIVARAKQDAQTADAQPEQTILGEFPKDIRSDIDPN